MKKKFWILGFSLLIIIFSAFFSYLVFMALAYLRFKYLGGDEYYFSQFKFENFLKRNILTLILYFSFYMVVSYILFSKSPKRINRRLMKILISITCTLIHLALMLITGIVNYSLLGLILVFSFLACLFFEKNLNIERKSNSSLV
jgi:hypothetical protein